MTEQQYQIYGCDFVTFGVQVVDRIRIESIALSESYFESIHCRQQHQFAAQLLCTATFERISLNCSYYHDNVVIEHSVFTGRIYVVSLSSKYNAETLRNENFGQLNTQTWRPTLDLALSMLADKEHGLTQ